jgi:hypothetical protein
MCGAGGLHVDGVAAFHDAHDVGFADHGAVRVGGDDDLQQA